MPEGTIDYYGLTPIADSAGNAVRLHQVGRPQERYRYTCVTFKPGPDPIAQYDKDGNRRDGKDKLRHVARQSRYEIPTVGPTLYYERQQALDIAKEDQERTGDPAVVLERIIGDKGALLGTKVLTI